MIKAKKCYFSKIAIIIMLIVFIMNVILSRNMDLFWIVLCGGGSIVDALGISYATIFEDFQLYRLVTYGYTQCAIWRLLANILALWYIGIYLEEKIGVLQFVCIYHIGLVVAGTLILICCPNSFQYGASPGVFACLGLLSNWLIRRKNVWHEYKSQKGLNFLLYYFTFSNIIGICTLLIHLFGFCAGFLLGTMVKQRDSLP